MRSLDYNGVDYLQCPTAGPSKGRVRGLSARVVRTSAPFTGFSLRLPAEKNRCFASIEDTTNGFITPMLMVQSAVSPATGLPSVFLCAKTKDICEVALCTDLLGFAVRQLGNGVPLHLRRRDPAHIECLADGTQFLLINDKTMEIAGKRVVKQLPGLETFSKRPDFRKAG